MPELDVDNQHIYYEIIGDGPESVLLLPGIFGTIDIDFAPIFPTLNKTKFRWICWDPPGYGRSRPPNRIYDDAMFIRLSHQAAKMMQILGYKKYAVAGWSQGGMLAIKIAEFFPENVNKVVFWGVPTVLTKRTLLFHDTMASLETWPKDRLDENLKYFDRKCLLSHCQEIIERGKKAFKERGGKFLGDSLPPLACPALILHGQKDLIVEGFHALNFKSVFKNSRIHYFPEGGHDLHLKFTPTFVKVVQDFLQE